MLKYIDEKPLVTVKLLGRLGQKFNRELQLRGTTVNELISGIIANFPEFKSYIGKLHDSNYGYKVFRGKVQVMDEEGLYDPVNADTLIIAPIVMGSGGLTSGFGGIILGAALIVAGVFTGGATIALLGAAIAASAISSMFSQKQETPSSQTARDQSFLFDFASGAGGKLTPIPCCYGRRMKQLTEDHAISRLIETNRIPISIS